MHIDKTSPLFLAYLVPDLQLEWLLSTPAEKIVLQGIDFLRLYPAIARVMGTGLRTEDPGMEGLVAVLRSIGQELVADPQVPSSYLLGQYLQEAFSHDEEGALKMRLVARVMVVAVRGIVGLPRVAAQSP